uniref:Uncharacterized protein n=1 Tax=Anguilla anguilla TaxID=7936 RepID=A0A0E9SAW0_ANGAN
MNVRIPLQEFFFSPFLINQVCSLKKKVKVL